MENDRSNHAQQSSESAPRGEPASPEPGDVPAEGDARLASAGPEGPSEPARAEAGAQESPESDAAGEAPRFTVRDRRFWALDEDELAADNEERPKAPSYVEQLQADLARRDEQLREYIAAYKREVGEGLAKTRERLERDSQRQLEQLRGQLTRPMMEVLDALELSISAAESGASGDALLQGVKMVHLLMIQKLQGLGLTRIEAIGQPFDPARHEAVAVRPVADASQDNMVVAELKPGFILDGRVVRVAQVQVGKHSATRGV